MRISALMTSDPITVPPTATVVEARALRTARRIRHLLPVEHNRLVGS
jgi:CBS domain-containing protein